MLRRALVLLLLILPLTAVSVTPAQASATESEFVSRANSARSSRGLRAYPVLGDLTSVARRQAARMAAARRIYHNPNLTSEVGSWRNVGENVGVGSTVSRIHTAFMNSSGHRANILSTTYTEIGVGTARGSDGAIYVSQVFRRPTYATTYAPARTTTTTRRRTTTAPARATTTVRASRSAARRPLPVVRPVAVRRAPVRIVDRTAGRLRYAYRVYRAPRPTGSLDHALAYVRASQLLVQPSR